MSIFRKKPDLDIPDWIPGNRGPLSHIEQLLADLQAQLDASIMYAWKYPKHQSLHLSKAVNHILNIDELRAMNPNWKQE